MNNYYLNQKSSLGNNFVNTKNMVKWQNMPYNDHKSSYEDKKIKDGEKILSKFFKSKKSIDDINNIDNPEIKEQINKIVKKYKK